MQLISLFIYELKKIVKDPKMMMSICIIPTISAALILSIGKMNTESEKTIKIYTYNFSTQMIDMLRKEDKIEVEEIDESRRDEYRVNPEEKSVLLEMNSQTLRIIYRSDDTVSDSIALNLQNEILEGNYQIIRENVGSDQLPDITSYDVMEDKDLSGVILAMMLPYMLILVLFINIANYTCDAIAGERERGVFDKLVLAPISLWVTVIAKASASALAGLISTILYISVILAGMHVMNDVSVQMTSGLLMLLLVNILVIILFLCGISVWCSLKAESVKGARTLSTGFMAVFLVLALSSMMRVGEVHYMAYLIPIYNTCIEVQDLLNNNIQMAKFCMAFGSTVMMVTLAWLLVSKEIKQVTD